LTIINYHLNKIVLIIIITINIFIIIIGEKNILIYCNIILKRNNIRKIEGSYNGSSDNCTEYKYISDFQPFSNPEPQI
jgi:hypothetical protein